MLDGGGELGWSQYRVFQNESMKTAMERKRDDIMFMAAIFARMCDDLSSFI